MCGIVGFFKRGGLGSGAEAHLEHMCAAILHRGPDDGGFFIDHEAGIALGQRRLAIVDLSAAGKQPMTSHSGRYVLDFNGEIYNHLDIRRDLPAVAWRGHSDTETLAAAVDEWGLEATLSRCVGMFALAIWDRRDRALLLARDRMGEKPLYYGWQKGSFIFASELKALRRHPDFAGGLDPAAVRLLLQYGYIPAPHSIHPGIGKLLPGTILRIAAEGDSTVSPYWTLEGAIAAGSHTPYAGSAEEARDRLESLLLTSIRDQSIADVPLGAFLSGGVDSSTVVALMQQQSSRAVRTFTIGFSEGGYNEANYAAAIARHLGTEHTELYVTPADALDIVPCLPQIFDEPFGDSSALPTYLVSRLARSHVTVSLSGDGGDELFGGYSRYGRVGGLAQRLDRFPPALRSLAGAAVGALPEGAVTGGARLLGRPGAVGYQAHRLAAGLRAGSVDGLYAAMTAQWFDIDLIAPADLLGERLGADRRAPIERMMQIDMLTYLPDDILCKVDRAAMAVSLEARVPMLDHRVVEFAWSLPLALKRRNGIGKTVLRDVLYKHVPRELIERPKMGFGVPVDVWLRGPLHDWAEDLLSERSLATTGLLDVPKVRRRWSEHLSGNQNWRDPLWIVLMLQAWERDVDKHH